MDGEFHDPLTLDLHRQTQTLVSKLSSDDIYAISISNSKSTGELLDNLSRALAVPAYTTCIATLFRPILFDLCARWVACSADLEKELVAICLLIEIHEELFPLLYRILQNPVLAQGPLDPLLLLPDWDAQRIHQILLAYYRILQANRELPYQLYWPLTPLTCYALQSGMLEAEREKWEKETLGELYSVECSLGYGYALDGSQNVVDGWLMPVIELERVRTARNAFVTEAHDFYSSASTRRKRTRSFNATLVCAREHLLNAYSYSDGSAGPSFTCSSSDDTPAMPHLLPLHRPERLFFFRISQKPAIPSRLTCFFSNETGNFEWKEGILIRAMREGKWVVFKDIDRGSNEVLALIKPLIESHGLDKWIGGRASLEVAGRGKVVAADTFAIFATRSVPLSRIVVSSPSGDELRLIVKSRYPGLTTQASKGLIRLWEAVRALGNTSSARDVGLRELEKFCVRTQGLISSSRQAVDSSESDETLSLSSIFPNTSVREEIFLCARDVFFGSGALTAAAKAHMEAISRTIATQLELEPERQQWLLTRWVPDFDIEKDKNGRSTAVRIGRTRLSAKVTKREIVSTSARPFAMHRPATLLLSRIASAIALNEPVLLTGETGTGKTSAITHLAHILHQPLISLNLSNQTESSDLIGGFRPLDARVPALSLQTRFLDLFGETFARKNNEKFPADVRKSVAQGKWKRAVGLWKEGVRLAKEKLIKKQKADSETPRKRRKLDAYDNNNQRVEEADELDSETRRKLASWSTFEQDVSEFNVQYVTGKGRLAFGFVEGPLVQALREGSWVLLDEINLASSETLECISSLLRSPTSSITLTEQGSLEPVPRHPNFRLFACMNPATDVGKKDLPPNIRSHFTEIDVPPPDADRETLLSIVEQYIGSSAVSDKAAIMNVAEFYLAVKDLAETRQIADGSNHRPHYSMRTLARALTFASDIAGVYGLRRALWEGSLMAFTMVLDAPSAQLVTALAQKHLLAGVKNVRSALAKEPTLSRAQEDSVKLGPFYLERGPLPPDSGDDYVLTPSVEGKLIDLARIILTRRFPVLIEGPTSSGKTSSVEYLARRTGHRFIRINNHEHTDIQEYLGSYVPHPDTGKLVFTDGLLVRALRNGDWIVLDELNLAPTDVLEALNRLLDDNRELVIPETGEVIRPHPHFMLFATQNPPGLYAGRKVLSRAFRNRFLEVHFEDVPEAELETILCTRCPIAPSHGKKVVAVFRELQKRRQSGRVFESKQGFATLRDLFRWAGRDALGYQELAENGYMLLAERARRDTDKAVVKEVIESTMNVRIDEHALYDFESREADLAQFLGCRVPSDSSLILDQGHEASFHPPYSSSASLQPPHPEIFILSTATKTRRTADLIGGLRPVRNRASLKADILRKAAVLSTEIGLEMDTQDISALEIQLDSALKSTNLSSSARDALDELRRKIGKSKSIFEWHDGPLVEAMRNGDVFLLDEISLADDSVLERLNSVLEPSRMLVLAERAADDLRHPSLIAHDSFKLVATMNPGGDYGKKELSPALRNRFTEIWVPAIDDRSDLHLIVNCGWKHEVLRQYTTAVLDFVEWLCRETGDLSFLNLRDVLAWVSFSNAMYGEDPSQNMSAQDIFHHAAHMTYLDGLGSVPSLSSYTATSIERLKLAAVNQLNELAPCPSYEPFIPNFNSSAPTTQTNAMRVVRACQLAKPILLEGSPGVGKTSLITALAKVSGHELCRINLSDQTDLIDLFGSDLPVDNGKAGEFAWKDGEFLRALQEGRWVLLDEMNLAPQAVLEGLNAVLDHRGSVYIPELGRTFVKHPAFRIFAAQNPLSQGGGRKGLPKSFINRFTKVYIDQLSPSDLLLVCQHLHPDVEIDVLQAMITFNSSLHHAVSVERAFGKTRPTRTNLHPADLLRSVYLHRFRNSSDRRLALTMFEHAFNHSFDLSRNPTWTLSASQVSIGHFSSKRENCSRQVRPERLLKSQLSALEAIGCAVSHSSLTIVTGARNAGKTSLVRTLAYITGRTVQEVHVNSTTDATDLLGGFEQVDFQNRLREVALDVLGLIERELQCQMDFGIHMGAYLSLRRAHCLDGLPESAFSAQISVAQSRVREIVHAANRDSAGRFEWIDGPLVRAIRAGHWLLLDGANLCNPSVLDRLNSLCETDGFLTLSEKGFVNGQVQILKPHPDFRLFMTVDPQYGELSRAMRNRGVEIALISSLSKDDNDILHDHYRLPVVTHPPLLPLTFTAVRLGVRSLTKQLLASRIHSGCVLDQDSSLCHLLDIASLLLQPFKSSGDIDHAFYHFLSRTLTPVAVPLLLRFLQSQGDLMLQDFQLSCQRILSGAVEALSGLRNRHGIAEMLTVSHMLGMPIDLFLGVQPSVSDPLPDHPIALQILHLVVAVVLHRPTKFTTNARSSSSEDLRVERTAFAITSLLEEAHAAIVVTLQMVSGADSVSSLDAQALNLICEVLMYVRYLGDIVSQSVLDYSALQLPVDRISAISEQLPGAFTSFRDSASWFEECYDAGFRSRHKRNLIDGPSDLRRQILNLMAMAPLTRSLEDQVSASGMIEALQRRIQVDFEVCVIDGNEALQAPHLSTRLALLAMRSTLSENSKRAIGRLISIACDQPRSRIGHLLTYQQSLWLEDAERIGSLYNIPTITASLFAHWMNDVWGHQDGPAVLFRPVQLQSTLSVWNWKTTPMEKLAEYETDLHSLVQLVLLNSESVISVPEQLTILVKQSITKIASCFSKAGNTPLPELGDALEHSAFERAAGITAGYPSGSFSSIFSFQMHLSTPPLFKATFLDSGHRHAASLSKELALHSEFEELVSGNSENGVTVHLQTTLAAAQENLTNGPPPVPPRDVSRLQMFWSEVMQFQNHVLSPQKLETLISLLKAGEDSASLMEQVVQTSMKGFMQRLQTVYKEFDDITFPILYALLHLQTGLRILKQSSSPRHPANSTATALLAFPAIRSAQKLIAQENENGLGAFQRLLLNVTAVSLEIATGIDIYRHLTLLENMYEQAFRLWNIDRRRRKKSKRHRNPCIAKIAPLMTWKVMQMLKKGSLRNFSLLLISEPELKHFVSLHHVLFSGKDLTRSWYRSIQLSALPDFLDSPGLAFTDTLDYSALPLCISLLADRTVEMQQPLSSQHVPYNFYTDANIQETRKSAELVTKMKERLCTLIREWPDQMPCCKGSFRPRAAAASYGGLGRLCEQRITRENSLRDNRSSIIELIVNWRRLELSCWQTLLEAETKAFEGGVSSWWFHLYDAIVRGPLDLMQRNLDDEVLSTYLDSLVPLLDDFIRGSPLGQFRIRLDLLKSFDGLCRNLGRIHSGHRSVILERTTSSRSTVGYFMAFSSIMSADLASERSTLETEVRNLVKLASWKDVNVHALKQSAQRTHRRLQATSADAVDAEEIVYVNRGLDTPLRPTFPDVLPCAPGTANHLINLTRTYDRFLEETLAVDIIISSKELLSISIPSSLSAERREKRHKDLLNRKRTAWSHLLKELKKAGFSAPAKSKEVRQNESIRWIREQPTPDELPASWDFAKIESYWNRLNGLFPILRANLSSHHEDVSHQQLRKESLLWNQAFPSQLNQEPGLLVNAFSSYELLRRHLRRIRSLASSSGIYSGKIVLEQITTIFYALSRMESTLHDLQSALQSLLQLDPSSLLNPSVADNIRNVFASCVDVRGRFKSMLDNVQLSSVPILLAEEYQLALEAIKFFQGARRPTIATNADEIINTCLAGVHDLSKSCTSPSTDEDKNEYIRKDYQAIRSFTNVFKVNKLLTLLNNELETGHFDTARYLPFLELYTDLVHVQLTSHAHWTKSLLKLNFVLCSVLGTICQQGFCKPPEADEEGSGDAGDASDGVGLGEGSGTNNVSKEIEEESQVEGLQGDEPESAEPRDDKDDDAIEMSEDFGGERWKINADPEEQIGDLDDSDPAAVDEKFWGDEKGPDDGDDKVNKDSSTQKSGESEDEPQSQPDVEEEDAPQEAEGEDSSHPDVNGAPMDEHVPEADTLELPDDINMDTGDAGDEADKMDVEEDEKDEGMVDSEEPITESVDEQPGRDFESPPPMEQDESESTDGKDLPDQTEQLQNDQNGDEEEKENSAVALPDIGKGDGEVTEEQAAAVESGQNASSGESGTSMGVAGEAASASENSKDQHGADAPEPSQAPEMGQTSSMDLDSTAGAAPMGSQHGQQSSQQNEQLSNNPLRSLADALKEVQRRFDEILDNVGQPNDDQPEPRNNQELLTLGPAEEEQVAKLRELNLVDDKAESENNVPPLSDIDMPSELEPAPQSPQGAVVNHSHRNSEVGAVPNPDGPNGDVDMEDVEDPNVELELRTWQASGLPDDQASHIWRLYESLTHELAYTLCEQLRLILEPTLATRLKGDYRTGKRLNMKKIIPYIASDYTKDKIWLRRTRPSQREYQVLIALDDSRSMAESHSVHLAYQTLALVSKALTRLEAGDVAIAKFGQDVQILHGFDGAPFSDQAGMEVIKAFHFDQKATNVLSLVDTSLRVLEAARERRSVSSSTAADLWQLEIIISDGMCQDHDKLRAALRKAEEQRVMIVFIIIDSLHSGGTGSSAQGSILTMQKAEFKNMELQLQRYLDSFPFEYYVVLRDVEALPQVLSATLKQFFERISEE
ncbi:P-loop containing nucleoside triphosphate hydrolase protein [Gymnopus androsaceus JB14]|uniref:Midasin n=1 Tax=Gymnopus androsaceus JB14 TaxID=1447944 RepID=A0A6A4I9W6_9AGAR|nr:P-loop containing nucleoside triphosphate hydrolase protein [Gymnopus androsaceus JB14]